MQNLRFVVTGSQHEESHAGLLVRIVHPAAWGGRAGQGGFCRFKPLNPPSGCFPAPRMGPRGLTKGLPASSLPLALLPLHFLCTVPTGALFSEQNAP